MNLRFVSAVTVALVLAVSLPSLSLGQCMAGRGGSRTAGQSSKFGMGTATGGMGGASSLNMQRQMLQTPYPGAQSQMQQQQMLQRLVLQQQLQQLYQLQLQQLTVQNLQFQVAQLPDGVLQQAQNSPNLVLRQAAALELARRGQNLQANNQNPQGEKAKNQ